MPVKEIFFHAMNDDEDYRDVNVYILTDSGAEWCMRVTLDKEKGTTYNGEMEYAVDQDDCFDVTDIEPPEEVVDALRAVDDKVNALLHEQDGVLGYESTFRNVSGKWVEE